MAREIQVTVWCDPCLADEVRNEGEELAPFTLPGMRGRARIVALCPVHRKELFDPLLELLREHGQLAPTEAETRPPARSPEERERAARATPTDGRTPRYHRDLYAEFFMKGTRGGLEVWACPGCGNEHTGQSNSLNNMGAHYRKNHGGTLASLLEEKLGPDRMAGLIRGVGGMLREAPAR